MSVLISWDIVTKLMNCFPNSVINHNAEFIAHIRSNTYFILNGINQFLDTDFTEKDMEQIYTYLGNACNHEKTLRFIASGYDMSVLERD